MVSRSPAFGLSFARPNESKVTAALGNVESSEICPVRVVEHFKGDNWIVRSRQHRDGNADLGKHIFGAGKLIVVDSILEPS